jgi:hypothetical protein
MSPIFNCHSLFSVSGPGVPATSLLTPLRAESCSSSGQSSSVVIGVLLGEGLGEGDALLEADGLGVGVLIEAEGVGEGLDVVEGAGAGVCPFPLHAASIAAATTMENRTRGEYRTTASVPICSNSFPEKRPPCQKV